MLLPKTIYQSRHPSPGRLHMGTNHATFCRAQGETSALYTLLVHSTRFKKTIALCMKRTTWPMTHVFLLAVGLFFAQNELSST